MLDVTLNTGGQAVRRVCVENTTEKQLNGGGDPTATYTYRYLVLAGARVISAGLVEHQYGNGPLELLRLVLEDAKDGMHFCSPTLRSDTSAQSL